MKAAKFWLCMAFLMALAFSVMGSSCGGSGGDDVKIQNQTGTDTGTDSDVQSYVNDLISEGNLNSDGTLTDDSISYNAGTSAKSLSKSAATQVTQGETLSPVTLSLGFETDIWRVYVNDSLSASATSPGVSTGEFRPSANGVTITASSASSAQIMFDTSAMSAGSNVIAVALVPYASKPNQEIAKTTLGTVTVSAQTTSDDTKQTTSGDKIPSPTSEDKTPTTSDDKTSTETETETETESETTTGGSYSATTAGTHALSLTDGSSATYSNITVTKTGDASGQNDDYDWKGTNAAILASGGSKLTITGSSTKITTNAKYGNAVFSYGGNNSNSSNNQGDGTTVTISDATITTSSNNSGGIMTTGGGIMNASNLTITTSGGSSAAIRSDSGGGTVTVNGGSYTTNGTGSPAIYSTAAITVTDADLTANVAQSVVIEGGNSVTLDNCKLTANHTTKNSQDTTYQAVLIYKSMSKDASSGASTFTMTDGSITNANGDIFCVTNTTTTINLSGVTITNNDSSGNFLRAEGQEWGTSGSNGGSVTLNASGQDITGNIIVDGSSSLTLNLKDSSTFTGAITMSSGGTVNVAVESGSTWTLTGNSNVTSTSGSGTINQGSYTLTTAQ